jgi:opacity protein-like surface antigen
MKFRNVLLLTALLFACASSTIQAQGNVRFGLTFSPSFNWFNIDNSDFASDGQRTGFEYGLLTNFSIDQNPRYAFEIGVLIAHNGGRYTMPIPDDSINSASIVARLQYVNLPVSIRLRTNEINYMTYFGQIGMTPAFNIRARGSILSQPNDPNNISEDGINLKDVQSLNLDGVNVFNIGLLVGGGLEYAVAENTSLIGGIYYQNGFLNIIDDNDNEKITMSSVTIRLGVMF